MTWFHACNFKLDITHLSGLLIQQQRGMELLSSLTPANAPSPVVLFKFAVSQLLALVRSVILLYPVNLLIFVAVIFWVIRSITKKLSRKPPFEATYKPLPHHQNGQDEAKVIKKQLREAQQQLIELLKKVEQEPGQEQPQQQQQVVDSEPASSQMNAELQALLREEGSRSEVLGMVEEQLRKVVQQTHAQISKLNSHS